VTYSGAVLGEALLRWFMTREMVARRQTAWARLKSVMESQPTGFN
jgi:hypothetical protein